MTRQPEGLHTTCDDCGLPYADFLIDTVLPDADWLMIHPDGGGGLLCAGCIAKRAAAVPTTIVLYARLVPDADHEAFRLVKNRTWHELVSVAPMDDGEEAATMKVYEHLVEVPLTPHGWGLVRLWFDATGGATSLDLHRHYATQAVASLGVRQITDAVADTLLSTLQSYGCTVNAIQVGADGASVLVYPDWP